ncbi:MAG TPA: matrixin family metalloprotease [Bryobacteraceae bacterium]
MNRRWLWMLILAALGLGMNGPESRVHLKTRHMSAFELLEERQPVLPLRQYPGRRHLLLQFRGAPNRAEIQELESRGARITGYVPDSGIIASIPDGASVEGLDLTAAAALPLENKLSPQLERDTRAFIVEFHRDVDAADAQMLLHDNGLEAHYHPDLLAHHALVYGSFGAARRIADWDEVAYVYPASAALTGGGRVNACPGPLTAYGAIGQNVASGAGDGWDGPGLGPANLGYYFGVLTAKVPRVQAQTEILRGLAEWSKYVNVSFFPAASPTAARTISILFATGAHGDSYPFDGPGKVLAHTFYPAPPNPEPLAGDMHFDNAENWKIGQDIDVFSIALHEAGHALGLGHTDIPGAVMYPYYSKVSGLTAEDVAAVRQLYATRNGSATPADPPDAPPNAPPEAPAAPTDPPTPGTPVPPDPPKKPTSDRVAPSLRIQSPPGAMVLTSSDSITFSGIASDNVGVVMVTWTDSIGNTGLAAGANAWTAAKVPLRVGTNSITIRAYDAAGNYAWRSVIVTRKKR